MAVPPVVRQMLVCHQVKPGPGAPDRVDLLGVTDNLRSETDPPFPTIYPSLCVFLEVAGCRGPVTCHVRIVEADTGRLVSRNADHDLNLPNDPLAVRLFSFRIDQCPFPRAGLYWLQFHCDGDVIHETGLIVRGP